MKTIYLLSLTILLAAGCTNEQEQAHETESIVLDDGKKWKVDDDMMEYIQSMKTQVELFQGISLKEHKLLAEGLKEQLTLLTSNCTMKGQAHDELHKWLLPHIQLIKSYSAAESVEDAVVVLNKHKESFVLFELYFN